MAFLYGKKSKSYPFPDIDKPLPEQVEDSYAMYRHQNKLLISDAGYGKTFTACLAAMRVHRHIMKREGRPAKVLVVVPSIALLQWGMWWDYCYERYGLRDDCVCQVIKSGKDEIAEGVTHLVVTYGMLVWMKNGLYNRIEEWGFDVFIGDEYEVMVNRNSKVTMMLLAPESHKGLCHQARWIWLMTATPIPRYNDGLYPPLFALFRKVMNALGFKSYGDWVSAFCRTDLVQYGGMRQPKLKVTGSIRDDELHDLLYNPEFKIAIRRKVDAPYYFDDVYIDIQKSKLLDELEVELQEGGEVSVNDFGQEFIDRSGPAQQAYTLLGELKVNPVAELVHQILLDKEKNDDPSGILVFFWNTAVGEELHKVLCSKYGYEFSFVDGRSNAAQKHEAATLLNSGASHGIVGQIKSMGAAIDVQKNCDTVLFAQIDWSDSREVQALKRAARRGQRKTVRVIRALTEYWGDQTPLRVAARKRSGAAKSLDGEK